MPRRNDISKILGMPGALLLTFLLLAVTPPGAQETQKPDLLQFEKPVPLRCSTIQLLDENSPLRSTTVKLLRQKVNFARPHVSIVHVSSHMVKKLKTNGEGELRLPKLRTGSYLFQGESIQVPIVSFEVDQMQPLENCSQPLRMIHATQK